MKTNSKVTGYKIKPKVTAIIQARMQSKRLPGKALLDLAGKPLLFHVIERTKRIDLVDRVVLATCQGKENQQLIELAESLNIKTFIGSEKNVLERYYLAMKEFGGDYIVRVTGDNPFTDVDYASMIVDIAVESKLDLCALSNLPLGAGVEVVKKEALEEAYKISDKPYYLEHVTTKIKEHPELFAIEKPAVEIENNIPNLRLTVDTKEDYEFAKIIYSNLYKGSPFPLSEVFTYLKKNPGLIAINKGVRQKLATEAE